MYPAVPVIHPAISCMLASSLGAVSQSHVRLDPCNTPVLGVRFQCPKSPKPHHHFSHLLELLEDFCQEVLKT
jgi:hypothetical protein